MRARKGLPRLTGQVCNHMSTWGRPGAGHRDPWARRRAGAEPGESERTRQQGQEAADSVVPYRAVVGFQPSLCLMWIVAKFLFVQVYQDHTGLPCPLFILQGRILYIRCFISVQAFV